MDENEIDDGNESCWDNVDDDIEEVAEEDVEEQEDEEVEHGLSEDESAHQHLKGSGRRR